MHLIRSFSILLFLLIAKTSFAQLTKELFVDLNLPPIIGRTLDFRIEKQFNPKISVQLGLGFMKGNKLNGSFQKDDDGYDFRKNSGYFATLGTRLNTRKKIDRHTAFIGAKYIAGHFKQIGTGGTNPDSDENGFYNAIGTELGGSFKITPRFWLDLGVQYSFLINEVNDLGEHYILPGMGAIGNLQGIVTLKFAIL